MDSRMNSPATRILSGLFITGPFLAGLPLAGLLALVTSGCATSFVPEPDLSGASSKDSLYVESSAVYVGMEARFVEAALGTPRDVTVSRSAEHPEGRETWYYSFGEGDWAHVILEQGRVVKLRDMPGWATIPER